ncbi:DUF3179 domain-containing protein [candidate division GN15 bacterium]|nr:DUF3179 domain-containing protein [candidate division GN15 bacterium]
MVYAATIDDTRYTFQASGSLWQDALVMLDDQTGSLWSQVIGEAIAGPMEGTTLQLFPSQHMTFGEFARAYPQGRVLTKPNRGPEGSTYDRYFASPDRLGIFGRQDTFDRLPAKETIYGLRFDNNRPVAISEGALRQRGLIVLADTEPPVAVTLDTAQGGVAAFELPPVATQELVRVGDTLRVSDGNVAWHAVTGIAVSADTKRLSPRPILTAFWFAWVSFFSDTRLIAETP